MANEMIDAGIVALLRSKKKISQQQMANELMEYIDDRGAFSASVISMWETGRRPIPIKYLSALASYFGVKKGYLTGKTLDPESDTEDILPEDKALFREEISPNFLYKYDGKPIYVEFLNYTHQSGWAIYNKNENIAIMRDCSVKMNAPYLGKQVKLYTAEYINSSVAKNSLDMAKMLSLDTVYIDMNTPDAGVRYQYNGWYQHNENHTMLINKSGLALPYTGINVAYTAYSPGDTYNSISVGIPPC